MGCFPPASRLPVPPTHIHRVHCAPDPCYDGLWDASIPSPWVNSGVGGANAVFGFEKESSGSLSATMRGRPTGSNSALVTRDVVCVGASAGGVEALRSFVASLPVDLPASIFIVMHVRPSFDSLLPQLLSKWGPLPAAHAKDGETIQHRRIYIAPPDRHLLIDGRKLSVVLGPKKNHTRPAVDPLFKSTAQHCGARSVGIVLSGYLADGTAGLCAIKRAGGVAIVQDPDEAAVPSMPKEAMAYVETDYKLPAHEIGTVLAKLATQGVRNTRRKPNTVLAL
jgi:chemotaxis response regulator CheB